MTDTIFLVTIFLLEISLFYFLPTLNGEATLFGIVLKDDDFQKYGFPILRNYRRELLIASICSLSALFLFGRISANSLLFTYIIASFVIIYPLFKYQRQAWKLRDKRTNSRLATDLKPRLLKDFSNLWFEATIILLSFAPFVFLALYYTQLPKNVPIHWNLSGEVDGWAGKTFSSVFFMPILALYLQIFWVILKQDIIGARFRIPAEHAEQVLSLKEISLRASVAMIDWSRLLCGILLGSISLMILSPILSASTASVLNIVVWTSLILLLAGMAFYLYRIILASREIKSLTGQITFQTAAEIEGWKDGLFYYNLNDTAFMVEKPGGVGYTLNFAHKRAKLYLALLILPELMAIITFVSMNTQ